MKYILLCAILALSKTCPAAEAVNVTVDPACVRNIGGETEFDRTKYITIHATPYDQEMSEADLDYLENELQVSYGRDGGSRSWGRKTTPVDPKRPDFPDLDALRKNSAERRAERRKAPEKTREIILCTHPETFYAREDNTGAEWGPRTIEGAAEFLAHFLKEAFDDAERPVYLEVFNEPFVKLKNFGGNVDHASRQHLVVARRVRELCPGVLIGGYTAAYPELEIDNFRHWNNWMSRFMDIAGAEMDFFSTHIYDGVNVEGEARQRTGSNAEAIMDIIDAYSHISFGVAKPHIISEFGQIPKHDKIHKGHPYSPRRSAEMIRSTNAQLMMFMDHPDRFLKVIPFFLTKGGWTYSQTGCSEETPYPFLLWRRKGDGYIKTDLVRFYEYWVGVEGQWRRSASSDPDVRCHLLVDGKRIRLLLTSIEEEPRTVNVSGLTDVKAKRVVLRTLTTHGDAPILKDTRFKAIPETIKLNAGESAMLIVDTAKPITPKQTIRETRCHATTYLQDIKANARISFRFEGVPTGEGTAFLRLGMGREQGKSRKPIVKLNGKELTVPTDWAGGDQAGRRNFFGMIEIPVTMNLLSSSPRIDVTFPDSGGKVSSAILQVNRIGDL